MANNIVKELNEIKDNYDAEIKDGKNMVEALDGIREAIEQDGEYTSSKDVANAVKDLGVALKEHSGGGSTELRHIVINTFFQMEPDEPYAETVKQINSIATYDANGVFQLGKLQFGGGSKHSIDAYYPTIDNKNIIKFELTLDPDQTLLIEAPEGVVVEETGDIDMTYTLTISKDISEPIKITLHSEEL